MRRPWNRCGCGICPSRLKADNAHRGRRVSRATSCALRSSVHAGGFSLTHLARVTFGADRIVVTGGVPDPEISLLMTCVAHDVWFRSFRDELSLEVNIFRSTPLRLGGVSPEIASKLPALSDLIEEDVRHLQQLPASSPVPMRDCSSSPSTSIGGWSYSPRVPARSVRPLRRSTLSSVRGESPIVWNSALLRDAENFADLGCDPYRKCDRKMAGVRRTALGCVSAGKATGKGLPHTSTKRCSSSGDSKERIRSARASSTSGLESGITAWSA